MSADVKAIEGSLARFPAESVVGYDEARFALAECCTPERMRRLLDERRELMRKAAEADGWRSHAESRLRSWQQRNMNRHGDRLALGDFMDNESMEDLIDFVCDEYVAAIKG